jgi:hypothetical protein
VLFDPKGRQTFQCITQRVNIGAHNVHGGCSGVHGRGRCAIGHAVRRRSARCNLRLISWRVTARGPTAASTTFGCSFVRPCVTRSFYKSLIRLILSVCWGLKSKNNTKRVLLVFVAGALKSKHLILYSPCWLANFS